MGRGGLGTRTRPPSQLSAPRSAAWSLRVLLRLVLSLRLLLPTGPALDPEGTGELEPGAPRPSSAPPRRGPACLRALLPDPTQHLITGIVSPRKIC